MSGGIAQLVSIGAQDAHIVGKPEVSFFRSNYKRHTNFAQTVERQVIQGNPTANGMSTVRFERKGDLLSYVYLAPNDGNKAQKFSPTDWIGQIAKVELLIGGQVIDEHTSTFSQYIAPQILAQSITKSKSGFAEAESKFYPLRFSFCENWQSAIPSSLCSTTTSRFASHGVPACLISGSATRTTCTWTPTSARRSPEIPITCSSPRPSVLSPLILRFRRLTLTIP